MAKTQPTPTRATITPAIPGPISPSVFRDRLLSALACCTWSAGTIDGMRPVIAGAPKDETVPKMNPDHDEMPH